MEKMTRKAGSAKRRGLGKSPALAAPRCQRARSVVDPLRSSVQIQFQNTVTKNKNRRCIKYGAYDLEE